MGNSEGKGPKVGTTCVLRVRDDLSGWGAGRKEEGRRMWSGTRSCRASQAGVSVWTRG